jgi:hypothetical protein
LTAPAERQTLSTHSPHTLHTLEVLNSLDPIYVCIITTCILYACIFIILYIYLDGLGPLFTVKQNLSLEQNLSIEQNLTQPIKFSHTAFPGKSPCTPLLLVCVYTHTHISLHAPGQPPRRSTTLFQAPCTRRTVALSVRVGDCFALGLFVNLCFCFGLNHCFLINPKQKQSST